MSAIGSGPRSALAMPNNHSILLAVIVADSFPLLLSEQFIRHHCERVGMGLRSRSLHLAPPRRRIYTVPQETRRFIPSLPGRLERHTGRVLAVWPDRQPLALTTEAISIVPELSALGTSQTCRPPPSDKIASCSLGFSVLDALVREFAARHATVPAVWSFWNRLLLQAPPKEPQNSRLSTNGDELRRVSTPRNRTVFSTLH